jgi:8-oxo-dGTP diphosphatase
MHQYHLDRVLAPRLRVAAGILRDAHGRLLLAERLNDHPFAGLWEFPGGKIDGGEAPEAALRRELREELGIELIACELLLSVEHDYPDRSVTIDFFRVTAWHGAVRPMLGQGLRWVTLDTLVPEELLPANVGVLDALNPAP